MKTKEKPIFVEYPRTTNRMEKIVISFFKKEKKIIEFLGIPSKIRRWEDLLIQNESKESKEEGKNDNLVSNPNPSPGPSPVSSKLNRNDN